MDFQSNLHSVGVAKFAQFTQRPPDLFEGLFLRDFLGKTLGPHLDARRADIVRKLDILFGIGNVPS
jgi:hypothetical protein